MPAFPHGEDHEKELRQGIHEGSAGAEGHQRVHVGRAVKQRGKTGGEELLVDDHHSDGQQQLEQPEKHKVVEGLRRGPAPHPVTH